MRFVSLIVGSVMTLTAHAAEDDRFRDVEVTALAVSGSVVPEFATFGGGFITEERWIRTIEASERRRTTDAPPRR